VSRRDEIGQLLRQGISQAAIGRRLGITASTVAWHARRLGLPPDDRFRRRYDWAQVQAYYDAGHSLAECQERFGFSRETWYSPRMRGELVTRTAGMPLDELLGAALPVAPEGPPLPPRAEENRCERCGLREWRGARLNMALHHVNGDGDDNRLENLELLCPNCHSQTENFAGRKRNGRSA